MNSCFFEPMLDARACFVSMLNIYNGGDISIIKDTFGIELSSSLISRG